MLTDVILDLTKQGYEIQTSTSLGDNLNNEIRIIVAGGRDFDDYDLLSETLKEYTDKFRSEEKDRIVIISGGARGADKLGEKFALSNGFIHRIILADWDRYGKSAGYIRNRQMAIHAAGAGDRGVLFAFWDGKSRGTKHMIDLAEKYGLETVVVRY